jgi:hypothetical protein
MRNEKDQAQSSGAVQDDSIVARHVWITHSDATTQDQNAESNATTQNEYTQAQYWEDEDEDPFEHRSYFMRQLTSPDFWVMLLQCISLALFTFHMVHYHGWPWDPKPSFAFQSMQVTQTAETTCIEFKGVATVCWETLKPGTWKIDPASGQITVTELL